jgi:streptogramin lyase
MAASKVGPNNYVTKILYKAPGKMPNGLQATTEGLWICDQVDPNKLFLVDYASGDALKEIPTRSIHGSGVTKDPQGRIWIASTFGHELIAYDPESGKEVAAFPTPQEGIGAAPHGIEYVDGELWTAMSKVYKVVRMDAKTGVVKGWISVPGDRPHGLAWDGETLWVGDVNRQVLLGVNPSSGQLVDAIGVNGPEPHGLTVRDGRFWLSDAETGDIFVLDRRHSLVDE